MMVPPLLAALVRRVYLRALGGVHLIAFLSLSVQIHGLVGEQGILPIGNYLKRAGEQLRGTAWLRLPTLCWLNASDAMLTALCVAGVLLALLLIAGIAPRLVLCGLWVAYLSLCGAGQAFLSFQWDTLLLEATLCSILYAPRGLRPGLDAPPPSSIARWVLWSLAFKLMFLSGATKLLSGDDTWLKGTALNYHYFTQPIPNWISWYVHHAPHVMHQMSLALMFLIETVFPFLVLAGRRGRAVFAISTMLLMAIIEATGNYGFFNLLTAVICLPLLDGSVPDASERPGHWRWQVPRVMFCTAILLVSLMTLCRELVRTQRGVKMPAVVTWPLNVADRVLLSWAEPCVLDPLGSFRTINGYGLFRVMTTRRAEIVIEVSDDGATWTDLEFPYKPGRLDRAPPVVAPHMPRLDWQMWFAALNPRGNGYWLSALAARILDGNPQTARLLGLPQLAEHPPRYVQFAYYDYAFSTPADKHRSGAWWVRTRKGPLTGPLSKTADRAPPDPNSGTD